MDFIKVESSNIAEVAYENEELWVKFLRGGTYVYESVPLSVFNDFLNAESKGKFFAENVKAMYPFRKEIA